MEQFDAEKARRVWSRVQADRPSQDWSEIFSIKTQTASIYRRLSRYFKGRTGAAFQRLYVQEQEHIATLSALSGLGFSPAAYTPPRGREPVNALLQQCYSHKLQLLSLYEAYAAAPCWSAFGKIVSDEQTQCRFLLQLMTPHRNR